MTKRKGGWKRKQVGERGGEQDCTTLVDTVSHTVDGSWFVRFLSEVCHTPVPKRMTPEKANVIIEHVVEILLSFRIPLV
jgi:hypothetical protein